MDTLLWIAQFALAAKFASIAFTHGLWPRGPEMQQAVARVGPRAVWLHAAVSVGALAGAIGLVTPILLPAWGWAAPAAAGLLTLLMVGALILHRLNRASPNTLVNLILLGLVVLTGAGRLWLVSL